jgi:hypothetical protein
VIGREFGSKVPVTIESDTMLGVTREYQGVGAALEDVKNARIFAGIHFRTATEAGTTLGAAAADYLLENKFQKVN